MIRIIPTTAALLLLAGTLSAQESGSQPWTLKRCIDYARQKNIQIEESRISAEISRVELHAAKGQRLPSLGFSTTQSVINQRRENATGALGSAASYSGNYGLDAGWTLYNGGKVKNTVRQQEALVRGGQYDVNKAENDIEIAVTQYYLEILYANEALTIARQTLEVSQAELARAEELCKAGSISVSDLAQIKAQRSSDNYQVTVAENSLAQARIDLKQLLELGLDEPFEVSFPELSDSQVLLPVPTLASVYRTALETMPEIQSSRTGIEAAELEEKIASAARLPTVSLSAGIGTGNFSGSGISFGNQLDRKFNQSAGLSISVPIFSNRQASSSIARAKLQTVSARLELTAAEKELLKTVESLHQDVVSAQSRYRAAEDQTEATRQSYELVSKQFDAGMKNTVELLTEKNNYLSAQREQLQAKYQAILSLKLLNFYRGESIEL